MDDVLYNVPVYVLAERIGIAANAVNRDIHLGIIPARREGRFWYVSLRDERIKKMFRDKQSYYEERRKLAPNRIIGPVMYEGKIYRNQSELAEALGVAKNTIRLWIQKGKVQLAKYAYEE